MCNRQSRKESSTDYADADRGSEASRKARQRSAPSRCVDRSDGWHAGFRRTITSRTGSHPGGDLRAGVEPELSPDLLDVAFRRALRDEQLGSDLPVRQSLSNKECHLSLPAGESRRHHNDSRRSIAASG